MSEYILSNKRNKIKIRAAQIEQKKYLGQTISAGAICGSILQIAFMGIKLFSKRKILPESCKDFLSKNDKRVIFCIGREVRGVPVGLIIYAARIQYNHMDEELNNPVAQAVFEKIATYETKGGCKDPAFDLANPVLKNYSQNIVSLLGWKNYKTYLREMKNMML